MIEAKDLALICQSALLLAGFWLVLFWLWPAVRLDCFRQRMFEVRDEVFDYAASGKIPFDHPAYNLLRQSMNGFIRYGHQISFWQILMTQMAWKASEHERSFKWEKNWQAALATLGEETRSDLLRFHERSTIYVAERIVFGSPVLMPSLVISIVIGLFHIGWKSLRELISAALSETAARAIDQRILDEEAARAAA